MKRNPINQRPALQTNTFFTDPSSLDTPSATDSELGIITDRPFISASCLLKYSEWLLISGLLLVLFAPLAGKIWGWPQPVDLKENRILAPRPDFRNTAWNNLPHAIDQWWNDRFAFRTQLIPLRESIWLDLLSAPGKQYVRGKDGQLFLNLTKGEKFFGSQNATVLDYLGGNHLTAEQLADWSDYLEGKSAWLRAYGIHYLFVIAPNKTTVEERFLPNWIRMAKGKSYFEQLREQVFPRLTQNVDLLDLTDVLIKKEIETGIPMFSRAGDVTHWNGAGYYEGLVAMDEHLRHYFPGMPLFPAEKLELQKSDIDPTVFSCRWLNDPSVHAVAETVISFRSGDWTESKCSITAGRNGNLVLFSDSSWKAFCGGLESFLPGTHSAFPYQWEHHRHADIHHVTFNELRQIVKEEQPNVVVEAQTERALTIPPGIGVPADFRLAARFARGNSISLLTSKDIDALNGVNIEEISSEGSVIVINATNDDPALRSLMSLRVPKESEFILFIDMDVPDARSLQVFWSGNDTFNENDSINVHMETGRNILFLPIPLTAGEALRLRIDPGTVAGKYHIRKIEIRAAPSSEQ
jgi:hypothetical protein